MTITSTISKGKIQNFQYNPELLNFFNDPYPTQTSQAGTYITNIPGTESPVLSGQSYESARRFPGVEAYATQSLLLMIPPLYAPGNLRRVQGKMLGDARSSH